jgi:hypothetical protein
LKQEGSDNIIVSVATRGAIREWNDGHPEEEVRPGDMITAVNGVKEGYFQMAEELWKVGQVRIDVKRDLSKHFTIGRTASRNFLVKYSSIGSSRPICNPVDALPKASAGELDATECAICFDDYDSPSDRVVVFPCKHCFHPVCAARWLCMGSNQCPLCKGAVDSTPPGPPREAWPEVNTT